ncbi:MAG: hypothetical protein AB8C13_08700 [Phycisphaerales bacterium]
MASEGSWESLAASFLGIGFGISASLGLGVGICRLGPSHEFRLYANTWINKLWWVHAPWLLIGPMTAIGLVIALPFRLIDPEIGATVMIIYIVICFFAWAIVFFACIAIWIDRYSTTLNDLGIVNTSSTAWLHTLYAFMIWIGSGVVGCIGGILGSVFIMNMVGADFMDF